MILYFWASRNGINKSSRLIILTSPEQDVFATLLEYSLTSNSTMKLFLVFALVLVLGSSVQAEVDPLTDKV